MDRILVSGANGHLGGEVIRNLVELLPDRDRLVAGSRAPDSHFCRGLARSGIEVRRFDFNDPDGMRRALDGVRKALFISTYDLNDVRLRQHRDAVGAAVAAGVRHVVYTSFINAEPGSLFEHNAQVHAPTERMIRESGLAWTFLRHNLYTEFAVADLKRTLETGRLVRGGADGRIAFIGRDDLGVSAACVLAGDGHENRVYTETGPEALNWAEVAAMIGEVFGRPVAHRDATPEEWYRHALGLGYPEPHARASMSNVRAVRAGEFSPVSGDYETIAGRAPRGVREYLRDHRETFLREAGR